MRPMNTYTRFRATRFCAPVFASPDCWTKPFVTLFLRQRWVPRGHGWTSSWHPSCDNVERFCCSRNILTERTKNVSDTRGPSPPQIARGDSRCGSWTVPRAVAPASARKVVYRRNIGTSVFDLYRNVERICTRGPGG